MLKFTLTVNDTEEITFKIKPSYKELETSLIYAISDNDNDFLKLIEKELKQLEHYNPEHP